MVILAGYFATIFKIEFYFRLWYKYIKLISLKVLGERLDPRLLGKISADVFFMENVYENVYETEKNVI